jgi:hypothetical protein
MGMLIGVRVKGLAWNVAQVTTSTCQFRRLCVR